MTIVVTVKINDGIVLAADSATTFADNDGRVIKIYNNANKVFNLVKGLPIGTLTFGSGGIGAASVATLTKDLRDKLSGTDPSCAEWKLDPASYTMEEVASKVRKFFYEQRFIEAYGANPPDNFLMGYKVCGYGAGQSQPELWNVPICAGSPPPERLMGPDDIGPRWDGEYEVLDRLILGLGSNFKDCLVKRGVPTEQIDGIYFGLVSDLALQVVIPAMPIQDAIELAHYMVETTIRFVRFNLRSETVGGPIEIAAITKHEGFKWVQRKLFFQQDLNPLIG